MMEEVEAPAPRSRESSAHSRDMRAALDSMLLDSRYHDVTFVCKGGASVAASRTVLAARCAYFEALFFGGLREAGADKIVLPHVHAGALQIVVDYLYTCDSPRIRPDESTAAAFSLADLYGVEGLGDLILDTLSSSPASAALRGADLDALLAAAQHAAAPAVAIAALRAAFGAGGFDPRTAFAGLSPASVAVCLRGAPLAASERAVLEAVLHWAAALPTSPLHGDGSSITGAPAPCTPGRSPSPRSRSGTPSAAAVAVEAAEGWPQDAGPEAMSEDAEPPARDDDVSLGGGGNDIILGNGGDDVVLGGSADDDNDDTVGLGNASQRRRPPTPDEVIEVLSLVALDRVPASFLAEVVEPLGLLPPAMLLDTYRSQALQMQQQHVWHSYGAPLRGCWDLATAGPGMHCGDGEKGAAPVGGPMTHRLRCDSEEHVAARTLCALPTRGVVEWEVVVVEQCEYVWVGVVDDSANLTTWPGKQPGGWMYGSNDALCHCTMRDNGPYGVTAGLRGFHGRVRLRLDTDSGCLSFSTDGAETRRTLSSSSAGSAGAAAYTSPYNSHSPYRLGVGVGGGGGGGGGGVVRLGGSSGGSWAVGFRGLPCAEGGRKLYPAVSLAGPGCVEMYFN